MAPAHSVYTDQLSSKLKEAVRKHVDGEDDAESRKILHAWKICVSGKDGSLQLREGAEKVVKNLEKNSTISWVKFQRLLMKDPANTDLHGLKPEEEYKSLSGGKEIAIEMPSSSDAEEKDQVDSETVASVKQNSIVPLTNKGRNISLLNEADFNPTENEERALQFLKGSSVSVKAEDLKATIESFMKSLPKNDAYNEKEVEIFLVLTKNLDIKNLLACGTKVLDAILYMAYHNDAAVNSIFNVKTVEPKEGEQVNMTQNIILGQNSFIAAIVNLYNRGNVMSNFIPEEGNQRVLPKILHERLFGGQFKYEHEVGALLSSASTAKFPAIALMNVDLQELPKAYSSRVYLSCAGARPIRYAVMSAECEAQDSLEGVDIETLKFNMRLEHAKGLVKILQENASFHQMKKLHPMLNNSNKPAKFALKMTRAVIESLSEKGRYEMVKTIETSRAISFTKDLNIMGEIGDDSKEREWPILKNKEADFSNISVETLRNFFAAV